MLQKRGVLWAKTGFTRAVSCQYGPVRAKYRLFLPCFAKTDPSVGRPHPCFVGMAAYYYEPPFPGNLQTLKETQSPIIGPPKCPTHTNHFLEVTH